MSFTASIDEIVAENRNGLLSNHATWCRVALGDVAEVLNGFPFDSKRFVQGGGAPLIRIRDIVRGSTETYYDGEIPDGYWVDMGEILVGMDGDFNIACWKSEKALLNQRVLKLSAKSKLYSERFLFWVVAGYLQAINENTPSVTVKHLSSKTVLSIPLPLPPLAEQTRIAAKLDELLAQVDTLKSRIDGIPALLKRFRQSVLAAAVSGRLTEEWRASNPVSESAEEYLARVIQRRRQSPIVKFKEPVSPDLEKREIEAPQGWVVASVSSFAECLDSMRVPVKKELRKSGEGKYPYFGANGEVDRVDEYIFDDDLVLVTEDETFYGREKPIAYKYSGKCWVNNHVHALRA